MTKTSGIDHLPNQSMVMIREDYVALCEAVTKETEKCPDSKCAAALMNLFEYWTNWKVANAEQSRRHNDTRQAGGLERNQDESLWIWKTTDEFHSDLMGIWGKSKIEKCRKWLVKQGLVQQRNNPDYGWDRTIQYFYDMHLVNLRIQSLKNKEAIPKITSKDTTTPLVSPSGETTARAHEPTTTPLMPEPPTQPAPAIPDAFTDKNEQPTAPVYQVGDDGQWLKPDASSPDNGIKAAVPMTAPDWFAKGHAAIIRQALDNDTVRAHSAISGWNEACAQLRVAGYLAIVGVDRWRITEKGRALASHPLVIALRDAAAETRQKATPVPAGKKATKPKKDGKGKGKKPPFEFRAELQQYAEALARWRYNVGWRDVNDGSAWDLYRASELWYESDFDVEVLAVTLDYISAQEWTTPCGFSKTFNHIMAARSWKAEQHPTLHSDQEVLRSVVDDYDAPEPDAKIKEKADGQ